MKMWPRRQTEISDCAGRRLQAEAMVEVLPLPQVLSEFLSQHELETSQNQANSPGEVDLWASGDGAWRAGEDKVVEAN